MRIAGLDSGTYSVDIAGLDDTVPRVFFEKSIPRREVSRDPSAVVAVLEELVERHGVEAIVVSSGYGIALKKAVEAEEWEIRLATFMHPVDEERRRHRILGLRAVMEEVKKAKLPAWFTPGVVHLETVPYWRKLNRIDIGTSDKVYSVAYVLRELVEDEGIEPQKASFIVVEAGYAYTAAIAVENGRIVDGIGGTTGFTGYMGAGCWDAELAYLAAGVDPGFPRETLFRGGLGDHYYGHPPPSPEEIAEKALRGDEKARTVVEGLAENAAKDVYALLASTKPDYVYVTGRWARIPLFMEALREKLWAATELGIRVKRPRQLGVKVKEAAIGAALLASGLVGGRYKWLVEVLGLKDSKGTILDYIAVNGLKEKAWKNLVKD